METPIVNPNSDIVFIATPFIIDGAGVWNNALEPLFDPFAMTYSFGIAGN